jgi:serine/threonine-protein kinase
VVGLSAARALERLQAAGLKGRTVKVASRRPKDQVLRQSPAPGTELKKDSVVVLTTSKGPRTGTVPSPTTTTTTTPTTPKRPPGTRVPNVVGLAQRVAVARLQSAGFRVDSYPAPSARPRGTVTAQGPPGGARAAPQSVVRIDVALGSGRRTLRTVPDVVGMTEAQAKQVLVRVGFTVRSVDQAAADRAEKDVVLDQRPAAGGSRPVASQVIIVVGRFPPPTS